MGAAGVDFLASNIDYPSCVDVCVFFHLHEN